MKSSFLLIIQNCKVEETNKKLLTKCSNTNMNLNYLRFMIEQYLVFIFSCTLQNHV